MTTQFISKGKLSLLCVLVLIGLLQDTAIAQNCKKELVCSKDFKLGSLKPRGTRRVVYNSDPSNTTALLSEPEAKPEELRQIVLNYARHSIDTLVQEVWHQMMGRSGQPIGLAPHDGGQQPLLGIHGFLHKIMIRRTETLRPPKLFPAAGHTIGW